MLADVFMHCDELIWNCSWLILASEDPANRWLLNWGPGGHLGVTEGLLQNDGLFYCTELFYVLMYLLMY